MAGADLSAAVHAHLRANQRRSAAKSGAGHTWGSRQAGEAEGAPPAAAAAAAAAREWDSFDPVPPEVDGASGSSRAPKRSRRKGPPPAASPAQLHAAGFAVGKRLSWRRR
ncbi:hypothetical protein EMIHUDRAFT_206827 [Emiliania huxleyi CCMP1516]|uniref:Uncharacterized protein n=2 Tax=Emiliania huxleyi TaxID=2903 RepID=A0A0D3JMI9_EMIH1|nr:hypothetical protein EMIHUDRAFT_206827 [Emiliania huxleyi CCMP1516]EOD24724.1 hypothetical protein EMIHUDRAFT_206827 [Emiliania huxleyi CCMP1516]|eukprot:XP_005777153.1 hypothetical protein EMIHUDRAFT_206827 [Emiliania huxleyi CCMP1516]